MKFINFSRSSSPSEIRMGCLHGNVCLDVSAAIQSNALKFSCAVSRIEDVLNDASGLDTLEGQIRNALPEAGAPAQEFRQFLCDEAAIVLQAPVLRPQKLIGIGLNYRDHAEETKMELPKEPLMFAMYSNAITAPNRPIVIGHEPED